jgi:hypothetical protein
MLKLLASTGVGFNIFSDFFGAIVNADDIVISAPIATTMHPVARPRGVWGFESPPLASRTTPGIRKKPQRNFFGRGRVPSILLQPT